MGGLFSREEKKQVNPPRIYIPRRYMKFGNITTGRYARQLAAEYINSNRPFTVEVQLQDASTHDNTEYKYTGDITISTLMDDEDKAHPTINALICANSGVDSGKLELSTEKGLEFEFEHFFNQTKEVNMSSFFGLNSKEKLSKRNCRLVAGVALNYNKQHSDIVELVIEKTKDEAIELQKSFGQLGNNTVKEINKYVNVHIPSANTPLSPIVSNTVAPTVPSLPHEKKDFSYLNRYNNKLFLYGGIHPLMFASDGTNAPFFGAQLSYFSGNLLTETILEYAVDKNDLETADVGISFIGDYKNPQTPSTEISISLKNLQNLSQSNPTAKPQIGLSYFNHLRSARQPVVVYDTSHKLITNFIDIGVEMKVDLHDGGKIFDLAEGESAVAKTNVAIATQWQINTNNMIKGKIDQNSIGLSYIGKLWWKPRLTFSVSATFDWMKQRFAPGFWIVLDTSDEVIREAPSKLIGTYAEISTVAE